MKIGVISDTHGLLRPEVIQALKGVDHILHAGDVGKADILTSLSEIAPTTAIRGNVDKGESWKELLNETEVIQLGGHWFYLVHAIQDLDIDPAAAGMSFVIFGHSHKPEQYTKDGVCYLNPGAAGHRRFSLPITLATVDLSGSDAQIEIIPLLS